MEKLTAADLSRMTEGELDALPYGAIKLSPYGTVLGYNATEGRMTGRARERVLGRNFFLDVAPCTDVQEFRGRFVELAKESEISIFQEFSFEFPFDPPLRVSITLLRDRGDLSIWVLVEPDARA
jgi:photoactive yellow protein